MSRSVDRRGESYSKLWIVTIIAPLLLMAFVSIPASSQNGCTPYDLWQISGGAGNASQGPGGAPSWQYELQQEESQYGGTPICNYTWNAEYGTWYGDCYVIAYNCTLNPPTPPPSTPPEDGGGPPQCPMSPPMSPPSSPPPSPPPSIPTCGSPINLTNGNTYIQQTDLHIPGLGGGLTLTRTWNSIWPSSQAALQIGLFGPNWRSTYEERVFVGDDATVKYQRSDGSFWSFMLYGSPASYHPIAPANAQVALTQQGNTSWTITYRNGEQRIFSYSTGLLSEIIDHNGNTTQLTYDASNRLTTVTDPAARHLYFTYGSDSSSLVTGVSSDVGVSVSYSYDNNGRLLQVTEPDQSTLNFQYDANSFISAVLDSNSKVLESHTYDSSGRGLTSSRANGVNAVTVSYSNQ